MSRKEAPRAGLLKALVAGRVRSREVAVAPQVSERQVRRLRRLFEIQGVEGLPYGNGGQVLQSDMRAQRMIVRRGWL